MDEEYQRLVRENLNWELKVLESANEPICTVNGKKVLMFCANNYYLTASLSPLPALNFGTGAA